MTRKTPSLAFAIDRVEQRLAAADKVIGSYQDDPSGYHARWRAEMTKAAADLTASLGASTNDRWDHAAVRICGIRSTSTSGLRGAFGNWLVAARKRIEKETAS